MLTMTSCYIQQMLSREFIGSYLEEMDEISSISSLSCLPVTNIMVCV